MEKSIQLSLLYMKYLYLLLLASLFCHSCKYQNEVPTNFNFIIDDGGNDYYNSEKGLFYREFIIESEFYDDSVFVKSLTIDKKEYSIRLNENDYKKIYELYKKLIFKISHLNLRLNGITLK